MQTMAWHVLCPQGKTSLEWHQSHIFNLQYSRPHHRAPAVHNQTQALLKVSLICMLSPSLPWFAPSIRALALTLVHPCACWSYEAETATSNSAFALFTNVHVSKAVLWSGVNLFIQTSMIKSVPCVMFMCHLWDFYLLKLRNSSITKTYNFMMTFCFPTHFISVWNSNKISSPFEMKAAQIRIHSSLSDYSFHHTDTHTHQVKLHNLSFPTVLFASGCDERFAKKISFEFTQN